VKNPPKNKVLTFYDAFCTENLVKNRQNLLFLLKREYLKITPKYRTHHRKVLETWNLAKLYTKIIQREISGHFFDFWLFCQNMGRCRPKITKKERILACSVPYFGKNIKNKKSGLKFFFVLFLCTTWPNLRFLALFYDEFYTCAILRVGRRIAHFLRRYAA